MSEILMARLSDVQTGFVTGPGASTSGHLATWNGSGGSALADASIASITNGLSVFTSGAQGVVPASGGGTSNFLRADGSWAAPAQLTIANNTVLGNISGIAASAVGLTQVQLTALVNPVTALVSGAVPAFPGTITAFFRGDGTWASIPTVTAGASGLAPASGGGTQLFLRADATWATPPVPPPLTIGSSVIANGTGGTILVQNGGLLNEANVGAYLQLTGGNLNVLPPVTSVFGRRGDVIGQGGDYSFSEISGNISVTQMNNGSNANSSTFWRGDGTWATVSGGGGGAVSSVFTRVGAVVAQTGDYSFSQISGTVAAGQLPNPGASSLGGVESATAPSNQFMTGISTLGVPQFAQPAFTNLSGNIATTQMNSGTGASSSTFWRGDGTWATPAGGGGTPGGSNTQLQYNNSGVFGGIGNWTSNGTNVFYQTQAAISYQVKPVLMAGANITVYVSTTGNDSNLGTLGSPFATIAHAFQYVEQFDYAGGFAPVINLAAGTYNSANQGFAANAFGTVTAPNLFASDGSQPQGQLVGGAAGTVIIDMSAGGFIMQVAESGNWIFDGIDYKAEYKGIIIQTNATLNLNTSGAVNTFTFVSGLGQGASFISVSAGGLLGFNSNVVLTGAASSGDFNAFVQALGPSAQIFTATQVTLSAALTISELYQMTGASSGSFIDNSYVNPSNLTGKEFSISTNSVAQIAADINVIQVGSTVSTCDATSAVENVNAGNPKYNRMGTQFAGTPQAAAINMNEGYIVFKDTTNGPRTLAYQDTDGNIYCKQITRTINTQTGSYTMALQDQDGVVRMTSAAANTFTVPQDSAFTTAAPPIGTEVRVTQAGAGATTIAAGAGATVNNAGVVGGQWTTKVLRKVAANTWDQTNI